MSPLPPFARDWAPSAIIKVSPSLAINVFALFIITVVRGKSEVRKLPAVIFTSGELARAVIEQISGGRFAVRLELSELCCGLPVALATDASFDIAPAFAQLMQNSRSLLSSERCGVSTILAPSHSLSSFKNCGNSGLVRTPASNTAAGDFEDLNHSKSALAACFGNSVKPEPIAMQVVFLGMESAIISEGEILN